MTGKKILVRLPNWLGDLVMAAGFMQHVQAQFVGAEISVIVKKGLEGLLPFLAPHARVFVFDKAAYPGVRGAWRFGRQLHEKKPYDLFFSLPNSLSAAVMGWTSGARVRVGYASQGRSLFLTHAFAVPAPRHRVLVYVNLLEQFVKQPLPVPTICLYDNTYTVKKGIVVNINSEAASRRLTVEKAVDLLHTLQQQTKASITLIGAPKEQPFVHEVLKKLPSHRFTNQVGKTTLPQLATLLASAAVMLTTDSGPAHVANALETHTVVLFGAGNELETAPFNEGHRTVLRLGELACEPCEKNKCKRYATPQCLERLSTQRIINEVLLQLNKSEV